MDVAMSTRRASCLCGSLRVTCEGDPFRISMCHCLACQRRTGSAFGVQARWRADQVRIEGPSTIYVRTGDSGGVGTMHFCPTCGSTVYWTIDSMPDAVAVAVGAFADPSFPAPRISVYEARKHPWVAVPTEIEHWE
jgi:hypothetical protein